MNTYHNIPFYYDIPGKSEKINFYQDGISAYIFVNQSEYDQPPYMEFLQKIMSAARLVANENAMIVPVSQDTSLQFSNVPSKNECKLVFFGISPEQINYQGNTHPHERFQTLHFHFLFAKRLADYSSATDKTQLWNSLKEMFL